jgi:hypothetical protein
MVALLCDKESVVVLVAAWSPAYFYYRIVDVIGKGDITRVERDGAFQMAGMSTRQQAAR